MRGAFKITVCFSAVFLGLLACRPAFAGDRPSPSLWGRIAGFFGYGGDVAMSHQGEEIFLKLQSLEQQANFDDFLAGHPVLKAAMFTKNPEDLTSQERATLKGLLGRHVIGPLRALEGPIDALPDEADRAGLMAYLDLILSNIGIHQTGDRGEAIDFAQRADHLIRKAVRLKHNSYYYTFYGDVQMQFIPLLAGSSIPFYATNAEYSYVNALRIDKHNARALAELGTWYVFAPGFAGGSTVRALQLFRDARSQKGVSVYIRYYSYLWQAFALSKDYKFTDALSSVGEALKIAPDAPSALRVQYWLNKGVSPYVQITSYRGS